jgi:ATP-dependent DNA ligase
MNFDPKSAARPKLTNSCLGMAYDKWHIEPKYDGIRAIYMNGMLWTRHGKPKKKFKFLFNVILDGELVGNYRKTYHVFDIMRMDNESIMHWPIEARKDILEEIIYQHTIVTGENNIACAELMAVDNAEQFSDLYAHLIAEDFIEGVVFKKKGSKYPTGETTLWKKFKGELPK